MKHLIYILIALLSFFSETALAQSKPKRDTSKDRSVVIREQAKKAALITEKKKHEKQNRSKTRGATIAEHKATYLKVHQSDSSVKNLPFKGGRIIFNVVTDGNKWIVDSLPNWCHVTKHPSWFAVTCDTNTTHDDRQGWFNVRCDNRHVLVNVSQQGVPLNIQAKFNNAYLRHNEYVSSLGKCMKITANVTISGAAGQKCWVNAFILDENGSIVMAKTGYGDYALPSSNNLCVASELVASTDNPETFTIISYIPNNAMNLLKKNNKLQCLLVVFCSKTKEYVRDATYTIKFKAKSKRGVVKTKHLK